MKLPGYFFDVTLSGAIVLVLLLHFAGIFPEQFDLWMLVAAAGVGTAPVLVSAGKAIFVRDWASMDMLASVALVFSLVSQEWASAAFIALMLAAARLLEDVTEDRTEKSIESLLKLRPPHAKVEREDSVVVVPLVQLRVGDIAVCDVGERIPADGSVISGEAALNESSLTGESIPVDKTTGARVFTSTLVESGNLRIRVEKVGKDTTLEKIIELVKSSREEKPKINTLAERFGKRYLIFVFVLAAVLFLATHNTPLVLAVVLVVCADDVAIAVPLAYLTAIGLAARRGVIIKGASHLEALGSATTVVFDKTGTLTTGKLKVSDVVPADGKTEKEVLRVACLSARRSKHPLSKAIVAYADNLGCKEEFPDSLEEVGGKGVVARSGAAVYIIGKRAFLEERGVPIPPALRAGAEALNDEGRTVSFVSQDGAAIGFFAVADELKRNAKDVIVRLKALGIKRTIMLTGDNERVAAAISKRLSLDEFKANLLPEEKVAYLKGLHTEGVVVMVGDGLNDAAALAVAHVGIAMGGIGYDTTIESANIVLMHDDLSRIPETLELARFTRKIAVEDFGIWGITNAAGLALVFGGVIGPVGAAAYNFISDFFPLGNSVRVRTFKADR